MRTKQETYDAALIHGYWLSYQDGVTTGSARTMAVAETAAKLYQKGLFHRLVCTGGPIWGDRHPPVSQVITNRLLGLGVPSAGIIQSSDCFTTRE